MMATHSAEEAFGKSKLCEVKQCKNNSQKERNREMLVKVVEKLFADATLLATQTHTHTRTLFLLHFKCAAQTISSNKIICEQYTKMGKLSVQKVEKTPNIT